MDISDYTFKVNNLKGSSKKQGSAFLISKDHAITAKHVLQTNRTRKVELIDYNNKHIKAKVVKRAPDLDVVILQLEETPSYSEIPELDFSFNPETESQEWKSYGFPTNYQKMLFGKRIMKTREYSHRWDYDIEVENNIKIYKGLSGSSVVVDRKVIGMIITDVPNEQLGVISLKRINSKISLDQYIKDNSSYVQKIEDEENDWKGLVSKGKYNKYFYLNTKKFENHIEKYPIGKYSDCAKKIITEAEKWFEALSCKDFNVYSSEYAEPRFTQTDFDNRHYYLSLKNIWTHGDTDIFPYPFENRLFKDRTEEVINALNTLDKEFSEFIFKDNRNSLSFDLPNKNMIETVIPIGYTGFRWVTQIEPLWNVYYLSLVLKIADKVESKRNQSSFASNFFSYRYAPDYKFGSLFLKRKGYQFWEETEELLKKYLTNYKPSNFEKFQNRIFQDSKEFENLLSSSFNLDTTKTQELLHLSQIKVSDWLNFQVSSYDLVAESPQYKFIVSCDIADFYNRISHNHIRDSLYEYEEVNNSLIKLIELFADEKSHGLPIGGNASRILAENILFDFDEFLYDSEIKFARFVDDYYIFAKTEDEANKHLNLFYIYLLSKKGLSLQKHKIQIFTRAEFLKSIETRLFWNADDIETKNKARAMALARFDYYSEVASEAKTKNSIDVERLLNEELRKSRIHEQLANRLLQELSKSPNDNMNDRDFALAVSKAFYAIFYKRSDRYEKDKILKLYPILRKLLISIKTNIQNNRIISINQKVQKVQKGEVVEDVSIDTLNLILHRILSLYDESSYVFDIDLHKAYWFYLLSKLPAHYFSMPFETKSLKGITLTEFYKREYKKAKGSLTKSWLLINLLVSNETGEFKRNYERYKDMNYWEKRVYIIGAVLIESLNESKIDKNDLNQFERIMFCWAEEIGSIDEFKNIL